MGKSLLIGEYQHTIDQKGRLIMPAKFREAIGGLFYITKGLDKCLRAYSEEEWSKYMEKINAFPDSDKFARQFKRQILANSYECEVDKQGRVLISTTLREYAGLEKDVVVIGQATFIEIWDKAHWESYQTDEEISLDDLAAQMSSYGL